MKTLPLPENEQERLASLYSYHLLDTLPEADYNNLTKLASSICNVPVSLITLLDEERQWFKAAYGTAIKETPREYAFCAHAILTPQDITIVQDAKKDERFSNNPLVTNAPNIAFYAGVPLTTKDGYPLGSLCVLDDKPNNLTPEQTEALKILAQQAMQLIELHKTNNDLLQSRMHLQEVNNELNKFAQVIANDLQKPCDSINELSDIVMEKYADELGVDGRQILSLLKYSCENIKATIGDTLKRAQVTQLHQEDKMLISFGSLMEELKGMLPKPLQPVLQYAPDNTNLYTFKKMVLQVLLCLVSNGISYNNKTSKRVQVSYIANEHAYTFIIADNGLGLQVIQRSGVFEILGEANTDKTARDTYKEYLSNLNYARQLVHKMNGKIETSFEAGTGSQFTFSVGR